MSAKKDKQNNKKNDRQLKNKYKRIINIPINITK